MLVPKSLRKALIPHSLFSNPSPGSLQSTRLALHVNGDDSYCSVFIASGCRVYKIEVLCGQWKESKKEFSFRGDSYWLGFGKCAIKDVLAGWCESGSIFVAEIKNM